MIRTGKPRCGAADARHRAVRVQAEALDRLLAEARRVGSVVGYAEPAPLPSPAPVPALA